MPPRQFKLTHSVSWPLFTPLRPFRRTAHRHTHHHHLNCMQGPKNCSENAVFVVNRRVKGRVLFVVVFTVVVRCGAVCGAAVQLSSRPEEPEDCRHAAAHPVVSGAPDFHHVQQVLRVAVVSVVRRHLRVQGCVGARGGCLCRCRSVILSFCHSDILSFCLSVFLSFCHSVILFLRTRLLKSLFHQWMAAAPLAHPFLQPLTAQTLSSRTRPEYGTSSFPSCLLTFWWNKAGCMSVSAALLVPPLLDVEHG